MKPVRAPTDIEVIARAQRRLANLERQTGRVSPLPRARFSVPYPGQTVTGSVAHGDGYSVETDYGIDFSQTELAECAHWETIDPNTTPFGVHHARIDQAGLYLCRAFAAVTFSSAPVNYMGLASFNADDSADAHLNQALDRMIFSGNDQTHAWQFGTPTTAFGHQWVSLTGVAVLTVGDKVSVTIGLGTDSSSADFVIDGGPDTGGNVYGMSFMDLTQLSGTE